MPFWQDNHDGTITNLSTGEVRTASRAHDEAVILAAFNVPPKIVGSRASWWQWKKARARLRWRRLTRRFR